MQKCPDINCDSLPINLPLGINDGSFLSGWTQIISAKSNECAEI